MRSKNIRYCGSPPWPFPNSLMVGFVADCAPFEYIIEKPVDALPDLVDGIFFNLFLGCIAGFFTEFLGNRFAITIFTYPPFGVLRQFITTIRRYDIGLSWFADPMVRTIKKGFH